MARDLALTTGAPRVSTRALGQLGAQGTDHWAARDDADVGGVAHLSPERAQARRISGTSMVGPVCHRELELVCAKIAIAYFVHAGADWTCRQGLRGEGANWGAIQP